MFREMGLEGLKEEEKLCRNEFGLGHVGCKRESVPESAEEASCEYWGAVSGLFPDREVFLDQGVRDRGVNLCIIAFFIDRHHPLKRFLGDGIVADQVVRKVVEDFHTHKEAVVRNQSVPFKDALVDDLNTPMTPGRIPDLLTLALTLGQLLGDLNDPVPCALVDRGLKLLDVVQDIHHQSSVSGAHLVDNQVLMWVVVELVFCHDVLGNRVSVPGLLR